jgi:hypothetical protein
MAGSTQQRGRKRQRQANPSNDYDEEEDSAIGLEPNRSPEAQQTTVSSRGTTASASLQEDDGEGAARETITVDVAHRGQPCTRMDDPVNESRTRCDSINIHDLSFILHPAHEVSTSEKNMSPSNSTSDRAEQGKSVIVARASYALGVTPDVLDRM